MVKKRIGIDVGGTNIKLALVNDEGRIIYSSTVPTRSEMGYEYTINNIKSAIYNLLQDTKTVLKDVQAIGFGFPGQIDCENGIVKLLPNIPGWVNVPIVKIMEQEFYIPTKIDNDARCATIGEFHFGAGKGCNNLICLTVGTGVGSGIILNGKIVRGANNAAGEIGHIKLQMHNGPLCGCGDSGCLEAFVSAPSIVAMAQDYIRGGKSTKYQNVATGKLSSYVIAQSAKAGDKVAQRIFKVMGEYLGIGLTSVVNLLNPERVIIGGGVADAGDIFFEPIRKTLKERAMEVAGSSVDVVPAQLGNSAGVIGASLLIEN